MIWVLGTAGAVFILDIATKALALHSLRPFAPTVVIPGLFSLSLVFNRGAAFGMFPGAAGIFMVLAGLCVMGILAWAARRRTAPILLRFPLGLICGGALGNLLDRVRWGHVVDFLDFYAGPWHWPAFNIADSSLCVGAGLLILHTLRAQNPSL